MSESILNISSVGHYRNYNINYVKDLFARNGIEKEKGRLIAISNGGYKIKPAICKSPDFGYRLYFDKKTNLINVQIVSKTAELLGHDLFRRYSVSVENMDVTDKADHVQNAILYKEYCDRVILNKRKAIEVRKKAK